MVYCKVRKAQEHVFDILNADHRTTLEENGLVADALSRKVRASRGDSA